MKRTFLEYDKPLLTTMVQADNPDRIKELIDKYIPYFDAVEEFCVKMNVPPTVTDRQVILDGIKRALVMRDRYTILFYLRDCGKFEASSCASSPLSFGWNSAQGSSL